MPTAGEAGLKLKSIKKASGDGASCKGKVTRNKPGASKIKEVKNRAVPNSAKSSIPVPVKKEAKGKENADPNVDLGIKINKKASKVKQAPDFRKLHRKWDDQLSKGKAVSKKKNTTIEPFKLAENNQQSVKKFRRPYAYNSEDEEDIVSYDDDDDFEIDSTALKGILDNTGIKDEDLRVTGRATVAAIPSSNSELAITQPSEEILKRTSIYYTRPPPQNAAGTSSSVSKLCSTSSTSQTTVCPLKPRNVDTVPATRSQVASCATKQAAWADEENDAFDFQPDSQALQSILSNTGLSFNQMSVQNTGRVTLAAGDRLTPYRKARQSFREESSKRTSIYYTGPRRTRPSPRACGMGRASVLGASQLTAGSALNSQKSGAYDPLQTVVGRQGNQEQENEPMVGLGARQFPTRQPEPGLQTASNNSLLTPGRKLVSSIQPSSARDQPSWAEIFTPQRGVRAQESAVQATRPQPSLEPLRTPAKQRGPQEDICTPQRLLLETRSAAISQGNLRSTFPNSSSSIRKPLVEFKQQHGALTADLQPSHDPMATPVRQSQTGAQAPRSDLPSECFHVNGSSFQLPVKNFTTPVRQGSVVSQSFSSEQPPLWSEIFTPQRVTKQTVATQSMAAHSFNDPLVTPLRQNLPVTKDLCSTHRQQPSMADICASQQGEDMMQDLGPRLQCSTVQITSFQPSVDTTQDSCSMEEFLTPQRKDGTRKEFFKLTTVEEEDDVALLERQALEDLGLLKITDGSHKDSVAASCTTIQENSDVMCSPLFNTLADSSRCAANEKRTLQSVTIYRPAEGVLDPSRSSCNATSTSTNQHSSFKQYPSHSPADRFALSTASSECRTNVSNTLHTSSFTPSERGQVTSREGPPIPFNSTPSKGRDDRPVQVVSPTPKVRHYKHVPSDNRSLSLRSAMSSLNPVSFTQRITTAPFSGGVNAQFRWEPNGPETTPRAFPPTTSASRRLPTTLAQDALLDMEVSVYTTAAHDRVVTAGDWHHRPMNPLAKVFSEGDSMHFLPICVHQSL